MELFICRQSHTWGAEGGFLERQEGLGEVESKERPKGFAKNQQIQIVTLDEQGDDGSLHPLVHEEDYPGSPTKTTLSQISPKASLWKRWDL